MTLLLLHIPKTGGSSLRKSLEDACGTRLLLDYQNNTKNIGKYYLPVKKVMMLVNSRKIKGKYDVIYGHFDPRVYSLLNLPTGMFFREPIARLQSHYHYLVNRGKISADTPITELASQKRMKNMYKFYLAGKTIEDLHYIGIMERYTESLQLLERMYGIKCVENIERRGNYTPTDNQNLLSGEKDNIRIYNEAVKKFDSLCEKYM